MLSGKLFKSTVFLWAVLILHGCQKYEQGPAISFKSAKERLTNSWKIVYAEHLDSLRNITQSFKDADYTLVIHDNGEFELSFYPPGQSATNGSDLKKVQGLWSLHHHSTTLDWAFTGRDDYRLLGKDGSAATILKLKKDELWLRTADLAMEAHFEPK